MKAFALKTEISQRLWTIGKWKHVTEKEVFDKASDFIGWHMIHFLVCVMMLFVIITKTAMTHTSN